jgi:hypothetical protein
MGSRDLLYVAVIVVFFALVEIAAALTGKRDCGPGVDS